MVFNFCICSYSCIMVWWSESRVETSYHLKKLFANFVCWLWVQILINIIPYVPILINTSIISYILIYIYIYIVPYILILINILPIYIDIDKNMVPCILIKNTVPYILILIKNIVPYILQFINIAPCILISFSSLSYDRSKTSSKASSPHSAIQSFLFQMTVSSPFLKVIQ